MDWRFFLLLLIATRAWSCSCAGVWPSVKQAWQNAPFVFLGTVELADPDGNSSSRMFGTQSVRVRVDETFKGGVANTQVIELRQGASSCDAKFRTGERAVFYLYRGKIPGSWSLPWCSRVLGSAEPAGDDLLFLRGLPQSAVSTRLSGEIELYEESPREAFRRVRGIPNIKVTIVGRKGITRETATNADGAYEVFGLRPGRYSVHIKVPDGLKVRFPVVTGSPRVKNNDAGVELEDNGGASVGFVLQADTQISGRMLNAKGAPLKGVCIDLESLEPRGENGARLFNCSEADGGFTMQMMPPGKYRLVARDKVKVDLFQSKSTLYYPGVRNREHATIISIEAGKYARHLDIRLPSVERRYRILGRLLFADGAPVVNATVTFTSSTQGYSETTRTDRDGLFGLGVIAGMKGQLNGQLDVFEPALRSCPELLS